MDLGGQDTRICIGLVRIKEGCLEILSFYLLERWKTLNFKFCFISGFISKKDKM